MSKSHVTITKGLKIDLPNIGLCVVSAETGFGSDGNSCQLRKLGKRGKPTVTTYNLSNSELSKIGYITPKKAIDNTGITVEQLKKEKIQVREKYISDSIIRGSRSLTKRYNLKISDINDLIASIKIVVS